MDTLSTFIMEVKTALDHVIKISEKNSEKDGKFKKGPVGDMVGKTLKAVSETLVNSLKYTQSYNCTFGFNCL